jgi:hypothetical protein
MKKRDSGVESSVGLGNAQEGIEQAEWLTETITRFSYRDETDWLEPLTTGGPLLLGCLDFYSSSKNQTVNLRRERFEQELIWCLQELRRKSKSHLPPDIIDDLFKMAVSAKQQLAAYKAFGERLEGNEFRRVLEYISDVIQRLDQISGILNRSPTANVPHRLSDWENAWIGTLQELVATIAAQLAGGKKYMLGQHKVGLKSGRTQLQSYLLHFALSSIETLRKQGKLAIGSMTLLIAYSHAAELIPYYAKGSKEQMTQRMKRAKKVNLKVDDAARRKVDMLSLLIMQMIKD